MIRRRFTPAELCLCTFSVLFIAFFLGELLRYGYAQDQGIFASVGNVIVNGGMPYRDAWDIKPPAIYLVYASAQALFGRGEVSIRLLEAGSLLLLCAGLVALARQHMTAWQPGVVACVFAVLAHVRRDYYWTAQAENFAGVAIVWAVVLAAQVWRPGTSAWRKWVTWAASGCLYGFCATLKPQLGMGALTSVLLIIWREMKQRENGSPFPRIVAPVLALSAGFVLPMALMFAWLLSQHVLPYAYEILAVWVPRYTRVTLQASSLFDILIKPYGQLIFSLGEFYSFGCLVLLFVLPPVSSREREGIVHLAGNAVFQMLGVGLQAKFFSYHFAAVTPLLAALSAWGMWKGVMWVSRRWPRHTASAWLMILLIAGLSIGAVIDYNTKYMTALRADVVAFLHGKRVARDALYEDTRRVAEYIRNNTPEGRPVYLWGMQTEVVELARRRSSSRYIMNAALRASWSQDAGRKELMQDLQKSPPSCIIVQHKDIMEKIVDNENDSFSALIGFPELKQYIDSNYRQAFQVKRFDVLLRKKD